MNVPLPEKVASAVVEGGRFVIMGASDVGKSSLAAALAEAPGRVLIDGDVGQSEIGPPGMMDVADLESGRWNVRGQWYVGSSTPFPAMAQVLTGIRRLCDRSQELGAQSVIVDTSSFVAIAAGFELADALANILWPCTVVAVQTDREMESWLRGTGAPVLRVVSAPGVRTKPAALRAARRATRLSAYFADAREHLVDLRALPLRGTRLGLGEALQPADHRIAARLLGCPVVHAERAAGSVAFWTLGMPRHDPAAAAAELGALSAVAFDAAFWNRRSVGFIGASGFCIGMGLVESVDWPSLTATVRVPLHSLAGAVALHAGLMRHGINGEALPVVPERQA